MIEFYSEKCTTARDFDSTESSHSNNKSKYNVVFLCVTEKNVHRTAVVLFRNLLTECSSFKHNTMVCISNKYVQRYCLAASIVSGIACPFFPNHIGVKISGRIGEIFWLEIGENR